MGINQDIVDQGHTIQVKVELDLLKVDVLGSMLADIIKEVKEDKEGKGSESSNCDLLITFYC